MTDGKKGCEIEMPADMVRVSPTVYGWVPRDVGRQAVSSHCLCRWSKRPDGSYIPVPFPYRWIRLSREVVRLLGFWYPGKDDGRSQFDTLRRLARAGFIDMVKVAPGTYLLDLDSWFAHLSACMGDEDFWDPDGDALRRYRLANFTKV